MIDPWKENVARIASHDSSRTGTTSQISSAEVSDDWDSKSTCLARAFTIIKLE